MAVFLSALLCTFLFLTVSVTFSKKVKPTPIKPPFDELDNEYDFIIVGAGTAGCALASRLTEYADWRVLLLEAGQSENYLMDVPLLVNFLQGFNEINWGYKTEPSNSSCLAIENNQCTWPRGRVMGGSSVLNYMIYTRGNRRDYDEWAAMGNPGWSYDEVLPYFKKLENNRIRNGAPGYRSKGGPITSSEVLWKSNTAKPFVDAGLEMGMPYVDYNGPHQTGVAFVQSSTKNGLRQSSYVGYIKPVKNRPNLVVRKLSTVMKVLIDKETQTAYGVRYRHKGKVYTAIARKEVIMSAGAINSPQLLMLSGVGPAEHLREMNIDPIVDLPVGENLMDHTSPGGLIVKVNVSTISFKTITAKSIVDLQKGGGVLASIGGCEALLFCDTENPDSVDGWPDIELLQYGAALHSFEIIRKNFAIQPDLFKALYGGLEANQADAFSIWPITMRPRSRGRILLKSKNPFVHPKIFPEYFTDPDGYDIDRSIRGIRKVEEMLEMPAMKKIGARLHDIPVPACAHHPFATTEYWACHTRYMTFTLYHYIGTCKMGPVEDATAVVDSRLRVHGVKQLRVVDASIFPTMITGHTNIPVYMTAEKAADMIKEDWNECEL